MVSDPITLFKIEGEKVEAVAGFFFLGSKITEDSDCSHEIRRRLLLGRKAKGFSGGTSGKETACDAGDLGLIPGWGRSLGEGNGNPFQYSCPWDFPWTEKPGRLRSLGLQRVTT